MDIFIFPITLQCVPCMGLEKRTEVDQEELDMILAAVKQHLSPSHYKTLEDAIKMLIWLQSVIKKKTSSIRSLARMLFGRKTDSLNNLKKQVKDCLPSSIENSAQDPQIDPSNAGNESSPNEPGCPEKTHSNQMPRKNHGRRPLEDYNIAKMTHIPHNCLKAGEKCPLCKRGTLYNIDPQTLLVIRGQSPLKGEVYSAQGLRCHLCQQVFRAIFPKEVANQPKADLSARAIVCLAKYQLGTPLYRLETWQKLLGLPISDAEMWEWTESVALILFPVHQALLKLAAKGEVIHNDDTKGRVLELMKENDLLENRLFS